jgi:two-component system chemotaxis sensor kinase CheA
LKKDDDRRAAREAAAPGAAHRDETRSAAASATPAPSTGATSSAAGSSKAAFPELDDDIIQEFVQEGSEQLADADTRLLDLEKNPRDEEALNAVFRSFHTIKGLAGFLNLEDLQTAAHASEDLLECARGRKLVLHGPALDLVFQATDVLEQLIRQVGDSLVTRAWPPPGLTRVPTLVDAIQSLLLEARESAPPASALDFTAERGGLPEHESAQAARATDAGERVRLESPDRSIRVDAQRLDHLVDLVGELVITESMVNRAASHGESGQRDLRRHMLRLDKITRELQELAGSLRMVPVQGLFRKMARLARDTAKKCGKEVVFEAFGEDTELDKTVVEKVADPLVHLVRNAIDHGLEADPQERAQRGKPAPGRLQLRAFHKSGKIFIEVEDDGRGLNRAAIMDKAIATGLLRKDEVPAEHELFALICQPGFSTAAKVTAFSGRGVGMDVVKRNIVSMGGSLDIRSEPGKGTCFAMKLPLTLAVIDGMLVRAGSERYVIPTLSVVRLVEPRRADITSVLDKHELLQVQGESLPLIRLTSLFATEPGDAECRLAVIAESDGKRLAILVDELLGQQQAVIKSMGTGIGETPGVSGCAILSDGRVGLVIDIAGLLQLARTGPTRNSARSAIGEPRRSGLEERVLR